jgi:3-oxoacyl-[acyl-carrier protein] reductase
MGLAIRLDGKLALVTGASRGIGEAIVRSLAAAGATVALAARSRVDLLRVACDLNNPDLVFEVDLAEAGAGRGLAERVLSRTDCLDILVNNAGVAYNQRLERVRSEDLDRVLRVNLQSTIELSSALASPLFESRGVIVNVSSMSGLVGAPFQGVYAASKGGLDAFTRSLACEWGPRGVRVNAVAPGIIMTDMWADAVRTPGLVETLESHTALRRRGRPEDVAHVVTFLASDLAAYITGQTIVVDGGLAEMVDLLPR